MIHTGTCANCGEQYSRNRPLRGSTCSHACASALFKRKIEQRQCPQCGKIFEVRPSLSTRFCSSACFNRSEYRGVRGARDMVRICEQCGKSYRRTPGATKRRFCSNKCAMIYRFGEKQHKLPGIFTRGRTNNSGRPSLRELTHAYKEAFPYCQRCGWKEEPAILHVHHKDRNRKNKDFSNFESLCPTCHVLEHFRSGDSIWNQFRT